MNTQWDSPKRDKSVSRNGFVVHDASQTGSCQSISITTYWYGKPPQEREAHIFASANLSFSELSPDGYGRGKFSNQKEESSYSRSILFPDFEILCMPNECLQGSPSELVVSEQSKVRSSDPWPSKLKQEIAALEVARQVQMQAQADAEQRRRADAATEAEQQRRRRQQEDETYERKTAVFRKSLKEGDDTSIGVVVEIKGALVRIQTNDSQCTQRDYRGACVNYMSTPVERWAKRSEVFPPR